MVNDVDKVKVLKYARRYGSCEAARKFDVTLGDIRNLRTEFRRLAEIDNSPMARLDVIRAYEVPRQKVLLVTCNKCGGLFSVLPSQPFERCPSCGVKLHR